MLLLILKFFFLLDKQRNTLEVHSGYWCGFVRTVPTVVKITSELHPPPPPPLTGLASFPSHIPTVIPKIYYRTLINTNIKGKILYLFILKDQQIFLMIELSDYFSDIATRFMPFFSWWLPFIFLVWWEVTVNNFFSDISSDNGIVFVHKTTIYITYSWPIAFPRYKIYHKCYCQEYHIVI